MYFLCFITSVLEISPRAACTMSVQTQWFSSRCSREVAQAFSKPGNFASTVMTMRTEKSLKNPVFLSDFLFLMFQGHAWSSQTSCGKYLIYVCCTTSSWISGASAQTILLKAQ